MMGSIPVVCLINSGLFCREVFESHKFRHSDRRFPVIFSYSGAYLFSSDNPTLSDTLGVVIVGRLTQVFIDKSAVVNYNPGHGLPAIRHRKQPD